MKCRNLDLVAIRAEREQSTLIGAVNTGMVRCKAVEDDLVGMMELIHVAIGDESQLRADLVQESFRRGRPAAVMADF